MKSWVKWRKCCRLSMSQRGERKHFRRSLLKKRCCVFWSVAHSAQPFIKLCMLTSIWPYADLNSQATFCMLAHWARYIHMYMGVQVHSQVSIYLYAPLETILVKACKTAPQWDCSLTSTLTQLEAICLWLLDMLLQHLCSNVHVAHLVIPPSNTIPSLILQELKLVLQSENKQLAIRYAQLRAGVQVWLVHTCTSWWAVVCRTTSGTLAAVGSAHLLWLTSGCVRPSHFLQATYCFLCMRSPLSTCYLQLWMWRNMQLWQLCRIPLTILLHSQCSLDVYMCLFFDSVRQAARLYDRLPHYEMDQQSFIVASMGMLQCVYHCWCACTHVSQSRDQGPGDKQM